MKEPLLYIIARPILTILFKIIYRPKFVGKENMPTGNFVLAGNHTNNLDCLLIGASTRRVIHFLAKDSLYKGWKKPIFKCLGIIPVDRSKRDKSVLIAARKYLNEGKVICVFPEGTINRTEDIIMPFKMGAVKMSYDTASPIVPFIITGKYKLFGSIKIEFLKPYYISSDIERENRVLMEKIKSALEREKDEILK